jgi:hypothetical protein
MGGKATFAGWEYMPLFKGRRRLLTNIETTSKSNHALIDLLINCCEIFASGSEVP